MNAAEPFGIVTSEAAFEATIGLLASIGYLRSGAAPVDQSGPVDQGGPGGADEPPSTAATAAAAQGPTAVMVEDDTTIVVVSGPPSAVGVGDVAVIVSSAGPPSRIVRLAVADPLGVWCAWHLDGLATAQSDVDRFLHDPSAGLVVRCSDGNHYELMPLATEMLHNRAMFVDVDPRSLTSTVTSYCRDFAFRPITAVPFHHDRQMTVLQRGGRQRMTLGLLTPNETTSGPTPGHRATQKAD